MIQEQDLNFQLGFYVGEQIVIKYLPTTSVDITQTRNVIQCTIGESDEYARLDKIWYKAYRKDDLSKESKEAWKDHLEYYYMLQDKYLPKTLKCRVPRVTPDNMENFIDGLIDSLWNCDACSYSLKPEDISFDNEYDKYATLITFKLSVRDGV